MDEEKPSEPPETEFLNREGVEDVDSELEAAEQNGLTRRKFLATASPAILGSLGGCVGPSGFDDYGEFSIGIRDPLFDGLPFTEYYSPPLEQRASNIEERAESNLSGRSVSGSDNKVLMDLNYYTDDQVLSWMEETPELVGDPEAVTRLVDWKHYSIIRMGIKAGGYMQDIQQYLEKDLQTQYANNAADPFYDALRITYSAASDRFDINPDSDERDDQFIGIDLYMLGNGNSRAGRYFNTSEIKEYSQGSLSDLRTDLEEEATSSGGFNFSL